MGWLPCSESEMALVSAAKRSLRRLRRPGKNTVVAGVLTDCGRMYLGLDVVSRKSSVCAEPSAISQAHFEGFYSIAAVCFTPDLQEIAVISPCGSCRELIWYQHPEARVVMPGDPEPVTMAAEDLFVSGDLFTKSA